jgi:hypothetical protein
MDRPLPESVFDNLEQLDLKDFPNYQQMTDEEFEAFKLKFKSKYGSIDPREDLIDPHVD